MLTPIGLRSLRARYPLHQIRPRIHIGGDVPASAIIRVATLRPITGWRYFPSAKGRTPCGCPARQTRGEPFSRRCKDRFAAENS